VPVTERCTLYISTNSTYLWRDLLTPIKHHKTAAMPSSFKHLIIILEYLSGYCIRVFNDHSIRVYGSFTYFQPHKILAIKRHDLPPLQCAPKKPAFSALSYPHTLSACLKNNFKEIIIQKRVRLNPLATGLDLEVMHIAHTTSLQFLSMYS